MRLIHCADVHLDSKMTANLTKEKARERKKELLLTFERMVDYASEHQVDGILIAGDLFDTKRISASVRQGVTDAIAAHPEITFFYLKGNHDTDIFLPVMEEVPENLKLFGSEWTSYPLGEEGKIVISGLELNKENVGRAYYSLVLDSGKFNIVMLHGQEAEAGAKEKVYVIRLRELKNKGIDYLALGHIHSYKEGELDSRGSWCQPGCLEGRGFDECGEHGFVLLDIDETSRTCVRQFVPFAARKTREVFVDVTDCDRTSQMADKIGTKLEGQDISGEDLVKIVLTGSLDVECEKDISYLEKKFQPEFYFVKIEDETTLKVDKTRFVFDQSLKGEFIRLVLASDDLAQEDKTAVIRYGLRAITGEEITECD